MPAPTPTGTYAIAKHYLREAIARSSGWQSMTGLADLDARRARVLRGDLQGSARAYPCCFVLEVEDSTAMHSQIGVGSFLASIRLAVDLWGQVGSDNDSDAEWAAIEADSAAGVFLDLLRDANLSQVTDAGARIVITGVEKSYGPMFVPREEADAPDGAPYQVYRAGFAVQLGDST